MATQTVHLGPSVGEAPSGSAGGDLTGTYPNPTVSTVGAYSAANVAAGATLANAAVATNTVSTIVKRDSSGNFAAGTITATLTGTASGNTTYTPNQYGVVLSGAANAMSVLAPDASATKLLKSGGSSANPSWLAYTDANTVSTIVARDSSGDFAVGIVKHGDGSVTAPAITFSSDLDCGLYRIGANQIAMTAGGKQAMDYRLATSTTYANVAFGGGSASLSDNYPLLVERTLGSPIILQLSNPSSDAGSGVKWQMSSSAGNNGGEMGLFAPATAAPDAYNGGNMTIRSTGTTAGIAYVADDVASAYHKFYAGGNGSGNLMQKIDAVDGISLYRTITAAATTGNQTINKIAGTVNIAAAGTTVTVTNSMVDASSIVMCILRTNDATAQVKNCVSGSGSFVITLTAAATAEVSIGFMVLN